MPRLARAFRFEKRRGHVAGHLGFGYRHAVAQKNPVGVRAAQITGGCVIIAAIIGVAGKIDGIWKRSESQSINISNSPTQAPIVQAAPNAHVTVNATPPLRDVQADASRPVRITTYIASESPYSEGTLVAGITWRESYFDVRLDLLNATDKPVEDVNLVVQLDTAIAGVAQLTDVPGLTATAVEGDIVPLTIGNDKETMPIIPTKGPDAQLAPAYRIAVPRLAAGVAAHLLIASAATNPCEADGRMPAHLFAPRRRPIAVTMTGDYTVADPSDTQRVHIRTALPFNAG